jgi:hypothetical protein
MSNESAEKKQKIENFITWRRAKYAADAPNYLQINKECI